MRGFSAAGAAAPVPALGKVTRGFSPAAPAPVPELGNTVRGGSALRDVSVGVVVRDVSRGGSARREVSVDDDGEDRLVEVEEEVDDGEDRLDEVDELEVELRLEEDEEVELRVPEEEDELEPLLPACACETPTKSARRDMK